MWLDYTFLCSILLIVSISSISCEDVLGCGGFVKAKGSIDFSRIHVALYTKQGSLKHKTECAPNNGYYFIPLYEHGEYLLKVLPPRGWRMTPAEVAFNFDGKTDLCSMNKDINFEFAGFGVTGSVMSKDSDKGPKGVAIQLYSADGKEVLEETLTDDAGMYVFSSVPPGQYIVRVSQDNLSKYVFEQKEQIVTVGEDIGVPASIVVTGYDVTGRVTDGQNPISGIDVSLVSKEGKTIRSLASDTNGRFVFKTLPVGSYEIKSENSKMKISPNVISVPKKHDHQTLAEDFVVKSFSLTGQVLDSAQGKPLANAEVEVMGPKGVQKFKSDKNGYFELAEVAIGSYKMKASYEGFDFETQKIDVTGPKFKLPSLIPARLRLSGVVDRESLPSSISEIRVKFLSQDGGENKTPIGKVLVSEEKGTFSIYLAPGKYSASVELNVEDRQKDIGFAPVQHLVTLKDKPVSGISFVPIKATVSGVIKCLSGNCMATTVSLRSGEQELDILKTPDGKFTFSEVLPGSYTLLLGKDSRCWKESRIDIVVSEDIDNIEFVQLGYVLEIETSHSTQLKYREKGQVIDLNAGHNTVCVESDQPVKLATVGCHEFQMNSETWNPLSPKKITLQAKKHSVSGIVRSKHSIPDISVEVKSSSGVITNLPITKKDSNYEFVYMAQSGEELLFTPKASEHLFEPENLHLSMDDACKFQVVNFDARRGMFLKGKIQPALENVLIKIKRENELEETEHLQAFTDKNGAYKIGPLPDEAKYEVIAEKPGYAFTPDKEQGFFKARKLASINISVRDESNNLLSGVVVSVSGGDYRSNTQTKDGVASFLALSPGQYYIKPLLKEYEFHPDKLLENVKEGETKDLLIKAKRIAFSLYGKVTSLNGEAEAGIPIAAVGTDDKCTDHMEEGVSEQNGDFRIRGLKPDCTYEVQFLSKTSVVEKIIPAKTAVKVERKDVEQNLRLIAMRGFHDTDVMLHPVVKGDSSKELIQVKCTMTSMDGSYSYSSKSHSGHIVLFPTLPKNGKEYSLYVETINDKFTTKKSAVLHFKADEYHKYFEMILTEMPSEKKSSKTSPVVYFVVPLLIAVATVFFAWDKLPISAKFAEFMESRKNKSTASPSHAPYYDSAIAGEASGNTKRSKSRSKKI